MSRLVYPDYNNSILNTITSILKHYNVETNHSSLEVLDKELNKNYKNIVFIVLDGMGDIVLNNISKEGFFEKNKLTTVTSVYPSTTTAAMTTYYSGMPPYESGWVAWSQYFKEYGRCLDMLSKKESYERNYLPHTIKKDVFKDVVGYKSIFEKIEEVNQDVDAIEIMPNYPETRSKKSLRINSLDEAINVIKMSADGKNRKFIFIYLEAPDCLLHKYGCTSEEAKEFIIDAEEKIEKLSNELEDTLIIVTADHGHKDIKNAYTTIDDEELFDMYLMPPALESRSIAYYIKEDKKEEFKKRFNSLYKDEFMLLSREEVLNMNLLGVGNKHKRLDDFIGDFLAVSISDSIIRLETYLADGKTLKKSTHCGLTEDEMLVPVIVIDKK